jgi:alpha-glucosidase (family GH31 glycosyl hydrolase)
MGRNGYIGSPMDLHRYNDFNYPEDQDRGPVNGLSFAYSGFPYVYPDVVGGTRLGKIEGGKKKDKAKVYLMRGAKYAAVNPSMSFGYGPWNLNDEQVLAVCRDAAQLHARLHPYIYSAVVKTHLTGFPYSMTPLPLAYPSDSTTYHRENAEVRGYQWLLGEALLATPLYGNDYGESNTRDVYLPAGKWIDYDSGKVYEGQTLLRNFNMPVDKTPLFVGGTGLVIEKIDGKLKARIYPVGFKGQTVFYSQDGKTKSDFSIKIHNNKSPVITDTNTGKRVKSQYIRHADEFIFIPGHNYKIE